MRSGEVARISIAVRPRFTTTARWFRLLAVVALCFSTPSVQDVVLDLTSWVTGAECCVDGCEESQTPCTQQCTHCVCSMRLASTSNVSAVQLARVTVATTLVAALAESPRTGHHEPPFRPPVG